MKKTIIEQIEIKSDGFVLVRLQLIVIDGEEVIASSWHRTSIPPGADVEAQMAAVNSHLAQMNRAPVGDACMARLRAFVSLAQPPEAVTAYKARIEAAEMERK